MKARKEDKAQYSKHDCCCNLQSSLGPYEAELSQKQKPVISICKYHIKAPSFSFPQKNMKFDGLFRWGLPEAEWCKETSSIKRWAKLNIENVITVIGTITGGALISIGTTIVGPFLLTYAAVYTFYRDCQE